jgi:hypothetical protein
VNHIDVLICKVLPPMICCCTDFETGRLGRFLHETGNGEAADVVFDGHWRSMQTEC